VLQATVSLLEFNKQKRGFVNPVPDMVAVNAVQVVLDCVSDALILIGGLASVKQR
jgi:hypothetical protein